MKKILVIAGTRPNFIKISQFKKIASAYPQLDLRILHSGQHYDHSLSGVFLNELDIHADYFFEIQPLDPDAQIAEIKDKLTSLIKATFHPDLIVLVGDVNSTRAAAEVAMDLKITAAHVESGLRSFDDTMPEEHNRIIADKASTFHFITEESGLKNLLHEGFKEDSIFFVGNTMIDTIVAFEHQIQRDPILEELEIKNRPFALVTIHRPSNVDTKELLDRSIALIKSIAKDTLIIFSVHPRTYNQLQKNVLLTHLIETDNLILSSPMGYFAFQKLIAYSEFIVTDSGGIQEEATFRKKPCITIRPNTERPST
ncbi:MAG: non-hydrolyzing UDP-N-acetylglucosamine 2-epimerase, partial [Chitinophagales bacterium]